MKSLHNAAGGKIFRFQNFTEEEAGLSKAVTPMPGGPAYVTFSDEDFNYRHEETAEAVEPEEIIEQEVAEEQEEAEDPMAPAMSAAEQIINEAKREAVDIIEKSRGEADKILTETEAKIQELLALAKEEGYGEGYSQGLAEGNEAGREQALKSHTEKYRACFTAIDAACADIDVQKQEFLDQHIKDLTDLALAVSEKVVCVALESSGEVIKRMILSAVAPAMEKQWAKVVISGSDAKLMEEDGIDIRDELDSVSEKIELLIVDDAESGACLVEFPDMVIDASTDVQMQNIKDIIHSADGE